VLLQTVNGLPKLAEHNNAAVADVLDVPAVLDVQGPPRQHPLWHCGHSHHYTSNGQVLFDHEPRRYMTTLYDLLKNV